MFQVARTFLELLGFLLFLLLRILVKKHVYYKTCSSDFSLYNKNNLINLEVGKTVCHVCKDFCILYYTFSHLFRIITRGKDNISKSCEKT